MPITLTFHIFGLTVTIRINVFGTHMDLFPDYTAGLYEKDGTAMVVSRGLGGSRKLPLRIGNRPEVVTVVLQTEN